MAVIMWGDLGIGAAGVSFRLFVGLVIRTVALAWRSALAGAARTGAGASPALARRAAVATMEYERAREAADATRVRYAAALKMERAHRLMQTARLCGDGEAYEEAKAGYEYARAVYEGWRARGADR
jgi:hypothetical protein